MQNRLDGKLILLYTLLVLQVFIVMIYVISTPKSEYDLSTTRNPVSFIDTQTVPTYNKIKLKIQKIPKPIINIINSREEIKLRDTRSSEFFIIKNQTSACWKEGLDNDKIRINENQSELDKCICKAGWHGIDCGQPEVVWRAIMASKQNIKLTRRRTLRRLIYVFSVHDLNSAIAEVIVEELYNVVDLFVICDFSNSEENFKHKLTKGLLKAHQSKIFYININSDGKLAQKPKRVISRFIWDKISLQVKNIKHDDIYVMTDSEEILNLKALMFLKVYDGWPQPIGFRLRWSVFGFFWRHPLKTTITVGACTVGFIYNAFRSNAAVLTQLSDETSERDNLGLVIGDLNHYGGWYCHYCQSPANIVNLLEREGKNKIDDDGTKNLDVAFIEDIIGGGVWIDGKTNLLRAYKSRESYFAPETVIANPFKYDWLVDNFYAKLDYY